MIQTTKMRQYGVKDSVPPREITLKRKWQFKPRSIKPIIAWGVVLFLGVKILLIPLADGVYGYVVQTREVQDLKVQYRDLQQKIAAMAKQRDYMRTPGYIEERGHQIGLIKSNEAKMVVMDSSGESQAVEKPKKQVEIGD